MAKKATRPAGRGDRRFLQDSKAIHTEMRKAKRELGRDLVPAEKAAALARLEGADARLKQLNRSRFERLAQDQLTTALRAMDALIKLSQQPRYAVILTNDHVNALTSHLGVRFEAVSTALRATLDNKAASSTVGVFLVGSVFHTEARAAS